jgi:uncharacterized protein YbjT (DUF2867 family)
MILVTGATGNVGRHLVDRLLAAGVAVRALTRDPQAGGLPTGAEAVAGDLAHPESLEPALEGVESVFLVWPFLTTEHAPGVLEVIGRHVRRVIYLSSLGVNDDADRQDGPINQFHADMERLIEKSGLEWTFLRAGTFAANSFGWAEQIRAGDVVRYPFAGAKAIIDESDIAAVAARVMTEASPPARPAFTCERDRQRLMSPRFGLSGSPEKAWPPGGAGRDSGFQREGRRRGRRPTSATPLPRDPRNPRPAR